MKSKAVFKIKFILDGADIEKKLNAQWNKKVMDDIKSSYNIEVKEDLISIISDIIRMELNQENYIENIIKELVEK